MKNQRTTQIFGEEKKKNNFLFYCLIIVLIILFFLFIILSNYKNNIYNLSFYKFEYEKNNVYQKFNQTNNETNIDNITINLFYYLNDDKESLNTTFFSERDQLHLKDVKSLIKSSKVIYTIILILIIIIFMIIFYLNKIEFRKIMAIVFIVSSLLCLLFIIILYVEKDKFNNDFTAIHYLLFNNDYWLLDPAKDNLVNLYPEKFWYDIIKKILTDSMIYAILFLIIGCNLIFYGYLKKRYYNKKEDSLKKK